MLGVLMPQAQALSWEQSAGSKSLVIAYGDTNALRGKLPDAYYEKSEPNKLKPQPDRSSPHGANAKQRSKDDTHVAAVPEPQTYAMMLTGLGLLLVTLKGRNKKHFG